MRGGGDLAAAALTFETGLAYKPAIAWAPHRRPPAFL